MEPFWVTAFLDLAPDDLEPAVAHWRAVTGYDVSPTRGGDGEFATLVPARGESYLKVQRLAEGPSRLHLDLHVSDVEAGAARAVELGASVVSRSGYVVLRSPGGFVFCLVGHPTGLRPPPADWGGHASAVDQVCLDVPPHAWEREVDFWPAVTGWRVDRSEGEYTSLVRPDHVPLRLLLQRLDDEQEQVTAHLDLATTDRAAETARHEALGARVVDVRDEWTVLRSPTGAAYCLTDRSPGPGG
ncbi:VOC family protein [Nocardioides sp. SYSU DS0663]|uniref:VOC family protein n=1 Tax=Nocardioides sp. SYSU DS0663 TaxID=3416445 RepID=UPI003F4B52B7